MQHKTELLQHYIQLRKKSLIKQYNNEESHDKKLLIAEAFQQLFFKFCEDKSFGMALKCIDDALDCLAPILAYKANKHFASAIGLSWQLCNNAYNMLINHQPDFNYEIYKKALNTAMLRIQNLGKLAPVLVSDAQKLAAARNLDNIINIQSIIRGNQTRDRYRLDSLSTGENPKTKVILIHANCHHQTARGDFVFAANIARDLILELQWQAVHDIDVILTTRLDAIHRFRNIYAPDTGQRILVEGKSVGLIDLETFDAVKYEVVAYIDANRCKHSPATLVKRILSPDTRILFVGNVNQPSFSFLFPKSAYLQQIKMIQFNVYNFFDEDDILLGNAGLGKERLGLPKISRTENLPPLSVAEQNMLPTDAYGIMYLAPQHPSRDMQACYQYIKLSQQNKYMLIGEYAKDPAKIKESYNQHIATLKPASDAIPLPALVYHQSLPNSLMRRAVAGASSLLVMSTGVTSTLEAMQDKKLPYYQYMSNNESFVAAYLIAVKSILSDNIYTSKLEKNYISCIISLSDTLFSPKPLGEKDELFVQNTLKFNSVTGNLIEVNQKILAQANGTIASRLLGFLQGTRITKDPVQLAKVCTSLRKYGETIAPVHEEALRRAAKEGYLFELKVLIKSMSRSDLNKTDASHGYTALHFAVNSKNFDCACVLTNAGCVLDIQDKEGRTPLHLAVKNGDRSMIKMLVEAGASTDILDNQDRIAENCTADKEIMLFFSQCHAYGID